jgi:hypothetical protein
MRQDGRNEPKKTRKKDLWGEAVAGERDEMGARHLPLAFLPISV